MCLTRNEKKKSTKKLKTKIEIVADKENEE